MLCCTFHMFVRTQKQDSGTVVFWLHHKGLIYITLCFEHNFTSSSSGVGKKPRRDFLWQNTFQTQDLQKTKFMRSNKLQQGNVSHLILSQGKNTFHLHWRFVSSNTSSQHAKSESLHIAAPLWGSTCWASLHVCQLTLHTTFPHAAFHSPAHRGVVCVRACVRVCVRGSRMEGGEEKHTLSAFPKRSHFLS